MFKLVAFISVLGLAFGAPSSDQCNPSVLDECGKGILLIGIQERQFPRTREDILEFCRNEEESDTCSKSYIKRCLKSLPQQLATILVNSATKEVQSWCEEDRVDEVAGHAECLADKQEGLDQCMLDVVKFLEAVVESDDDDNKLPHACCVMDTFRDCVTEAAGDCPPEAIEFIDDVINAYASDAFELACTGFEAGSDKCKELPAIDLPEGNLTAYTIFKPLVGILKSL